MRALPATQVCELVGMCVCGHTLTYAHTHIQSVFNFLMLPTLRVGNIKKGEPEVESIVTNLRQDFAELHGRGFVAAGDAFELAEHHALRRHPQIALGFVFCEPADVDGLHLQD